MQALQHPCLSLSPALAMRSAYTLSKAHPSNVTATEAGLTGRQAVVLAGPLSESFEEGSWHKPGLHTAARPAWKLLLGLR